MTEMDDQALLKEFVGEGVCGFGGAVCEPGLFGGVTHDGECGLRAGYDADDVYYFFAESARVGAASGVEWVALSGGAVDGGEFHEE